MPRVTVAHGGFTTIGGCEVLAADLLTTLRSLQVQTELICWGGSGGDGDLLLRELLKDGVRISCSRWRWGCRWGLPDQVMLLQQWASFTDAETLIFVKLLDSNVHRRLLSLSKRMILITPYRPAEIWKDRSPDYEILNSFQTVIVQAHAFENDLRELGYEGEVFVLPLPPPDIGEPRAWPSTSTMQVGFLGRLVPDKNLEYLINSFSSLREMGIAAHLHVFGDGSERHKLQSLSGRLGLAEQIEFHGSLARSGVPEAIDRCHLFAFSSRTEGQCLAALEILARGRPVLGTSVGAFPEFLSGVLGSVAPFDSPPAFAVAMRALAEPVLNGDITPADIQRAYKASFPRLQIIDQYMQILELSSQMS